MKWEYLVENLPVHRGTNIGIVKPTSPRDAVSDHLNARGAEGWELVQFGTSNGSVSGCDIYAPAVIFVFKRPKL
jgi:uncharacterized protein DUF4177